VLTRRNLCDSQYKGVGNGKKKKSIMQDLKKSTDTSNLSRHAEEMLVEKHRELVNVPPSELQHLFHHTLKANRQ
jgi:hypothetical protein